MTPGRIGAAGRAAKASLAAAGAVPEVAIGVVP